MYYVILDETHSTIVPSETGISFKDACKSIIEYCIDSDYELQKEIWEVNLERGEQLYSN
jgi:hypothetical protein